MQLNEWKLILGKIIFSFLFVSATVECYKATPSQFYFNIFCVLISIIHRQLDVRVEFIKRTKWNKHTQLFFIFQSCFTCPSRVIKSIEKIKKKATQLRVSRIVNQYIGCDALTTSQYDLQVISMPISKKSYRDHWTSLFNF